MVKLYFSALHVMHAMVAIQFCILGFITTTTIYDDILKIYGE